MKHHLSIRNLGPVRECEMDITEFTILTGPQSSGKSTIAKAVYFFRSIKQDILDLMKRGGPRAFGPDAAWTKLLNNRLQEKFFGLFDYLRTAKLDLCLKYDYGETAWIQVSLSNILGEEKDTLQWASDYNGIEIEYGGNLHSYLNQLESSLFWKLGTASPGTEDAEALNRLFSDEYECIYIPAGRSALTTLGGPLNYLFLV